MRNRDRATASAVFTAGMLAIGLGAAATAGRMPATRAAAAAAARGQRATPASREAAMVTASSARVSEGICSALVADKALAARLSADVQDALRGRAGHQAVTVYDGVTTLSCSADGARHFTSASIVKAIILAALLRWHQETGAPLSDWERDEATLMITQSDNDAATALWNEVGMSRLQRFLDLAKMNATQLGEGGYWGLTQVTAHDEMLLLRLLSTPNAVLSQASRSYQLSLMAQVISSQRWGTPAGAPGDVTVHVKNGWLPESSGWHINSLGVFTGQDKNYMMAVLTDDNPSEQYGIDTIEQVARVVHRDLNAPRPLASARLAANVASTPAPAVSSWARVPALPTPAQPPR
jgi:Beta-lactamase enzyme family